MELSRPAPIAVDRLRQVGLRPTRQRVALARLLFEGGDRHVSAEQLHGQAREEAWRRIKVRTGNRRLLALVRELAAWRERAAQERDLPRNRVLRDEETAARAARARITVVDALVAFLARIRGAVPADDRIAERP